VSHTLFVRWLRFNAAGLLGVVVQLMALDVFARHMDLRLATALAVETAVLHNFVWHEQITWRDRTNSDRRGWVRRLLRFHLSNGLISLVGNVLLMYLLAGILMLPLIPANLISIVACSVANFFAGEHFVFASGKVKPPSSEQMFI
jgi:putative flippase GtrA